MQYGYENRQEENKITNNDEGVTCGLSEGVEFFSLFQNTSHIFYFKLIPSNLLKKSMIVLLAAIIKLIIILYAMACTMICSRGNPMNIVTYIILLLKCIFIVR